MPNALIPSDKDPSMVSKVLLELVSRIPTSGEVTTSDPKKRAQLIARSTAVKAAGISGALSLPPGPFGLATLLPDLLAIWRLQQGMVADIAAAFGKSAYLKKETMIYCLFKHGGAALMRDLVVRAGERYLIHQTALKTIQHILQKIGIRVTQKVIGKSISRWVPVLGAVGVGAYAYYDTAQVAATAIELFSKDLKLADSKENTG